MFVADNHWTYPYIILFESANSDIFLSFVNGLKWIYTCTCCTYIHGLQGVQSIYIYIWPTIIEPNPYLILFESANSGFIFLSFINGLRVKWMLLVAHTFMVSITYKVHHNTLRAFQYMYIFVCICIYLQYDWLFYICINVQYQLTHHNKVF